MPKIVRVYAITEDHTGAITVRYAASAPGSTVPPLRWEGLAMRYPSRDALLEAMQFAELSATTEWLLLCALSEWTKGDPTGDIPQDFTREVNVDLTQAAGVVVRVQL